MPYFEIPDNVYANIFHKFGTRTNGFVFLIIFRRKWLVANNYLSQDGATRYFPSSEMCLGKCLVPGDGSYDKFNYKINNLLSYLADEVNKKMMFKGSYYELRDIYKHFPRAISLMFTFPRDLLKGSKKLIKKSIDIMLSEDQERIIRLSQHYDQEWISVCQSISDRRYNFGFIDIDYDIVDKYDQDYDKLRDIVASFLNATNLTSVYAVTTISGGLHIIVTLDESNRKYLFSKHSSIFNDISGHFDIPQNSVEISTTSNKITHLPFNPRVHVLTV